MLNKLARIAQGKDPSVTVSTAVLLCSQTITDHKEQMLAEHSEFPPQESAMLLAEQHVAARPQED